jgi:hypothetical protein
MSEHYDPPIVLVREITRYGNQLLRVGKTSCEHTQTQENGLLGPFTRLAAQMRMIDSYFDHAGWPDLDRFVGWSGRARASLKDVRDLFLRIKRMWGWSHLDCPEPFLSEAIAERKRQFEIRYMVLLRRCALSWVSADSGRAIDDPPDPTPKARELAREAIKADLPGDLDPWESSRVFQDLYNAMETAPCLGDGYPHLSETLQNLFSERLQNLERHVNLAAVTIPDPHEGPLPEPCYPANEPKRRNHRMPQPIGE